MEVFLNLYFEFGLKVVNREVHYFFLDSYLGNCFLDTEFVMSTKIPP